jgi:hypothetical protein
MKLNVLKFRPARIAGFTSSATSVALAALALTIFATNLPLFQVWAQSAPATGLGEARNFPEKSKLGELIIGVFPEASLNGQSARFSAGGRLINVSNMIVLPSSVYRQTLVVRYELDFQGNISRAWLLNPVELRIAQEDAKKSP